MHPPAAIVPAAELDEYWTDEKVCKSLIQFKSGCPLPLNVTSDVNPYQFRPSNLPADIWYFYSGVKEDAANGFWVATGEACVVFSDSAIIGLRNTLQFYEGRAPHGQKTNWMMQEYTTTENCSSKLDPRALCRVFLVDDNTLVRPELPSRHCLAGIDVTNSINSGPNTVSDVKDSTGQLSKSELLEKNVDDGTGSSAMAKSPPNPPLENFLDIDNVSRDDYLELNDLADPLSRSSSSDIDYVLRDDYVELNDLADPLSRSSSSDIDYVSRGDYVELNDLADPLSRSSSSADSSFMTMTSEEFFDSVASLRGPEDDTVDQEMKDSSIKFNISVAAKSKEVVMHPTTLESLKSGEESKPSTGQTSKVDHTPQNEPGNRRNESTSHGLNTTASSSSSEGTSKEEKKDRVGRTKKRKVMKYLCFMAF